MAKIFVNSEYFDSVSDDLTECPEDAFWDRALRKIFWTGVRAGLKADIESDIEVNDISSLDC